MGAFNIFFSRHWFPYRHNKFANLLIIVLKYERVLVTAYKSMFDWVTFSVR